MVQYDKIIPTGDPRAHALYIICVAHTILVSLIPYFKYNASSLDRERSSRLTRISNSIQRHIIYNPSAPSPSPTSAESSHDKWGLGLTEIRQILHITRLIQYLQPDYIRHCAQALS